MRPLYIPLAMMVFVLSLTCAQAQDKLLHDQCEFFGVWQSDRESDSAYLFIFDENNFYWGDVVGRYATKEDSIWLLEDNNTGTKWHYKLKGSKQLLLSFPEDFNYMGSGQYLYTQFSDPKSKITFTQVFTPDQEYVIRHHKDGTKATAVSFKTPYTGVQRSWYENGVMSTEVNFSRDNLHGKLTQWDKEGQVMREEEYENGKLIEK